MSPLNHLSPKLDMRSSLNLPCVACFSTPLTFVTCFWTLPNSSTSFFKCRAQNCTRYSRQSQTSTEEHGTITSQIWHPILLLMQPKIAFFCNYHNYWLILSLWFTKTSRSFSVLPPSQFFPILYLHFWFFLPGVVPGVQIARRCFYSLERGRIAGFASSPSLFSYLIKGLHLWVEGSFSFRKGSLLQTANLC